MKQFILQSAPDESGIVRLSGADYHYLARVRRFTTGTVFNALLPNGETVQIRVRTVKRDWLEGECVPDAGPTPLQSAPIPLISLFQALPKGAKMDLIVRQAVECGVAEIVPFTSVHSVPKIADDKDRIVRWERIVREARQQSGSSIATAVHAPLSVDGLLHHWNIMQEQHGNEAKGIMLHPLVVQASLVAQAKCASFHACLEHSDTCKSIALAIGPEGGFSPSEAARFTAAGFTAITLGNTILRTETAVVYAIAAIRIILLERASWILNSPARQ
ncbi:MAG: 16S rRNA (uracil(1498)-N(3))-methyltransferase [Treponema sp.]|jgi:16S rRNA (uracil1498-N3)-methyltransferase|nr:16S rRNA (uracil(1498)-N(3))-methyltransferase [Treponema sp.]